MNRLGIFIRSKREENNLLLRHLAAKLDMDVANLSKIERGERMVKSEHLPVLAEVFDASLSDLQILWAADHISKLLTIVDDKTQAIKALNLSIKDLKTQH